MKCYTESWTIRDLIDKKDSIHLTPRYQRGEAWKPEKQALLVDSILMGYAIPKFYFAERLQSASRILDVVDGQQRLRSIYSFYQGDEFNNDSPLVLKKKWGMEFSDREKIAFDDLTKAQTEQFLNTKIEISLVKGANNDQLRRLFLRLQMGSVLNQAELRNAIASGLGDHINAIVNTHNFFKKSGISEARYKRSDYLAHALLAVHGIDHNSGVDLSAENIKALYLTSKEPSRQFWTKADKVLDCMEKIAGMRRGLFKDKWVFVDIFVLLWTHVDDLEAVDPVASSEAISNLAEQRKLYRDSPEKLITRKLPHDGKFMAYIHAFYKDGGKLTNCEKRMVYLQATKTKLLAL